MRALAVPAALAAAAALTFAVLRPVQGASGTTGELAQGGIAKGDISKTAGDLDTIGVQLVAGSALDVRWASGFPADVVFVDPDGQEVDLGLGAAKSASVKGWPVAKDGRHEFRIASADGSQGTYTLKAIARWEKTVVFTGTGEATFDLPMPASSAIRGKVKPLPGASNPSILSLRSPADAELLIGPVVGSTGLAKLKETACATAGLYRFTATATSGTEEFEATLKRRAPAIPITRINIRNGLDQISYESDGVKAYFDTRCKSCHSFASNYAGVRAYANLSLSKMRAGSMPPGGPRATADQLSLIDEWIKTGYGR